MPAQDLPSPPQSTSPAPYLPSPQIFSILPEVHALLLRLQASNSTTNGLDTSSTNFDNHGTQQQSPLLLKDVQSAAAPTRLKIAKAKAVVDALPDIHRTIEQQEEEIAKLEAKVKRLRNTLGKVEETGQNSKDNS